MDFPVNRMRLGKVDSKGWCSSARWGALLIPARCLVCDEVGHAGQDLCRACREALHWNRRACRQCGLPMPATVDRCGRCLRSPPCQVLTQAALIYRFPVDRLVPRLKFHGDLAAGRLLAELFLEALPPRSTSDWPQALVPVPLHRARLRQRGYDQALELGKLLAGALDLPLFPAALQRGRLTAPQSELGAGARQGNVRGAFVVGRTPLPAHVALVDDVMTTGATVAECARVLRAAGVGTVEVWAIARAPMGR